MAERFVYKERETNLYYRASRKGKLFDNWVKDINLATVFYTNATNNRHRMDFVCDKVYVDITVHKE